MYSELIYSYTVDMYHMQEQTQRQLQHEVLIKEAAGDTHTHTHTHTHSHARVCVCVCDGERGRERAMEEGLCVCVYVCV